MVTLWNVHGDTNVVSMCFSRFIYFILNFALISVSYNHHGNVLETDNGILHDFVPLLRCLKCCGNMVGEIRQNSFLQEFST